MAVRPPQSPPRGATVLPQQPVKDVDDDNLEKIKARKQDEAAGGKQAQQQRDRKQKAVARKPGVALDTPSEAAEEHVAEREPELRGTGGREAERKKADEAKKTQKSREARQRRGEDGDAERRDEEPEPETPQLTASALLAGSLADQARRQGFQQTPSISEVVLGKQQVPTGPSFAQVLPEARSSARPLGGRAEIQPPAFLSTFEGMKDVYLKLKGRASPKTRTLLESPDLEDLVQTLADLHEDDDLKRSGEARLRGSIYVHLKDDPGPLLVGLNDARLTEPWKLFLDGWDIWVPPIDTNKEDPMESGVELFWEGEAEDEDGEGFEITQSLSFQDGELRLHTVFADEEDELIFKEGTFYRLKRR